MWWKNAKVSRAHWFRRLRPAQWTMCLGVLVLVIIAGAVGGGIKGNEYVQDHHNDQAKTQTQPSTSAAASSTST